MIQLPDVAPLSFHKVLHCAGVILGTDVLCHRLTALMSNKKRLKNQGLEPWFPWRRLKYTELRLRGRKGSRLDWKALSSF